MQYILILSALFCLVYYFWVAYKERHLAQTPVGFFQSGRNTGFTRLSGTYIATSLALANAIFYFLWLGYNVGLSGLWIQLAWCLGFGILWYYLPILLRETNANTLHGYLEKKYGKVTAKIAATISFVGIGLNFGYEVLVGSTIFSAGWPEINMIILVAAACITFGMVICCRLGGFSTVIRTDTFQWLIAALALLICLYVVATKATSQIGLVNFIKSNPSLFSMSLTSALAGLGLLGLLSNLAFSLPWQIVDVSSWQKISSCDPSKLNKLKYGVLFSGLLIFFVPGIITLFIGIFLRGITDSDANLMGSLLLVISESPILLFFVLVGFLSALISTADTFLVGAVQTLIIDIFSHKNELSNKNVLQAKKFLPYVGTLFLLIVSVYWLLGNYNSDSLFQMVYIVYSMQLSLTWVVLFAVSGARLSDPVGSASIAISVLCTLLSFFVYGIDSMPIACLLGGLVGIVVGAIYQWTKQNMLKS